ncbi:MAG: SCO family protein [Acidimicrobiales bacterium]
MSASSRIRRALPAVVVAAVLVGSAACGSGTGTASSTGATSAPSFKGVVRSAPLQVGDVTLPDQTAGAPGTPFAFRAKPGELLVGYFGYTSCPDVCPTTLANLKAARQKLGAGAEKVDLAMETVDPERDTPEVLAGYLSHFADRYHALRTTDPAQLQAAEEVFGASSSVTKTPEGKVEVVHTGTAYVIDEHGTVLVEWPFGISADDMANDLRAALARIGTPTTTGSST